MLCNTCNKPCTITPLPEGFSKKDIQEGLWHFDPRYYCPSCKKKIRNRVTPEDYKIWFDGVE